MSPFQILSSREVYRNHWIRVREDDVIRPGGKRGPFGVVEMKAGSSVLALNGAGEVYLVSEFKYAVARESIEVISGGIDEHESPLDAARRELKEEAGLEADEWIDLGVIDPFTSVIRSPNYLFLARGLSDGQSQPDEGEVLHRRKVPLATAVEMVWRGEITHAASCVLILKAGRRYISP